MSEVENRGVGRELVDELDPRPVARSSPFRPR